MSLADYGWRTLYGSLTPTETECTFVEESVAIHGNELWDNIEISADFSYKGSDIGVVLCYNNTIGYLLFSVSAESCKLLRVPIISDDGTTVALGNSRILKQAELLTPLVVDTTYTLKVERVGTNVKCYIGDELVINTEERLYGKGQVGIYGKASEVSLGITVSQLFPSQWSIVNAREADIVTPSDTLYGGKRHMIVKPYAASTNIIGIKQTLQTIVGQQYTIYCSYIGESLYIAFGSEEDSVTESGFTQTWHTFTATDTSTDLIIGSKGDTITIVNVQVEAKLYGTSYVYNDSLTAAASRQDTVLTYPANNNIDVLSGSINLWIKPKVDYTLIDAVAMPIGLFYHGDSSTDCIRLYYNGTSVVFQYGDKTVSIDKALAVDGVYHIVATWDVSDGDIKLFVAHNNDPVDPLNIGAQTTSGITELTIDEDIIHVGGDDLSHVCNAVIDNLIVYKRALSDPDIYNLFIAAWEPGDTEDMILRANFNNSIGKFNNSIIDITPAPLPGTPIIVKKADGTILRKVSFTGANNKYVTDFRQVFTYNGGTELNVAYENVDYDFPYMGVYTMYGLKIVGAEAFDQSYLGHNLKLSSALAVDYLGDELVIWYQPKDCYTVDFNTGENDVCRITLSNNEGEPVTIIYEANQYVGDYALAETVDLNAMNNPNHQGFMYITQSLDKAEIFRINISPDELVANGFNYAIITMEVVDKYGNPVSNADYEVMNTLQYGTIQPYYSPKFEDYLERKGAYITGGHTEEEWYENYGHYIGLNEMAGRQMFLYRARRLNPGASGYDEVTERIIIRDKVSGLGTEISIRLVIKSDYKLTN